MIGAAERATTSQTNLVVLVSSAGMFKRLALQGT